MTSIQSYRWLAVVLACCSFSHLAGCEKPTTETILFEVDRQQVNDDLPPGLTENELIESLVIGMDSRLNGEGRVHLLPNGQIQVDLTGKLNQKQLDAMKRRVATRGNFEFRILASPVIVTDKAIVEKALAIAPEEKEVVVDGGVVAKWAPCRDANQGPPDLIVYRTLGVNSSEALALIDPLNVTGEYLRTAEKTAGHAPSYAGLRLTLSPEGAKLLRKLTSDNQPTPTGERHAMALILDDVILSAPTINAVISDSCILEGMTTEEVDALIAILNAGTLPLPVREVPKSPTP